LPYWIQKYSHPGTCSHH